MSTSFEFLPRSSRRVREDLRFPAVFILLALFLALAGFYLRGAAQRLQTTFEAESATIEKRKTELLQEALAMIPEVSIASDLETRINQHNLACIGPRFPWSRMLKTLEQTLPNDSVISSINNPRTGKPQFQSGDREFSLTVAVPDVDIANSFYSRLSALSSFQNLSFTPKGEMSVQGRRGTAIDISFRYQEAD